MFACFSVRVEAPLAWARARFRTFVCFSTCGFVVVVFAMARLRADAARSKARHGTPVPPPSYHARAPHVLPAARPRPEPIPAVRFGGNSLPPRTHGIASNRCFHVAHAIDARANHTAHHVHTSSQPPSPSPSLSTSLPLSLRHSLCRPPSLSTSLNFNLASPLPRCLSQPLSVSRTVWCDRGCIESLSGHGTRKGCSPSSWGECRCGGSAALGQSRCRRLSLAPILSNSPWHSPQVSANLPTHAAHSVTSFSSTSIHAWHRLPSTLHHPGHSYPPSLPHPHRGSFFPILRGCGPPSPSPSPSGESRCPE